MSLARAAMLLLAMTPAAPALAADSQFMVRWHVLPAETVDMSERSVSDGEWILKQTLLPFGLAILGGNVAEDRFGKLVAKDGAQLVQASLGEDRLFCALSTTRLDKKGAEIENKRGITLCFLDADKNGRFEAMFEADGGGTGVHIQGMVSKTPSAIDTPYEIRPPEELKGDYWVGIRYEQYFNIYGNRMLFLDFGGQGTSSSLTSFSTFKSKGEYPHEATIMGARITLLAPEPKSVRLRVDATMPAQPFMVYSFTTTSVMPVYY